ncbi:alpha/beta fold hydrolase [Tropicimonas marinistellae]|uniref:alpha/beta fold hydrolase n=1 Tax=Tropicimonas marinistellae TaxID=1739787 RepID=UPI000829A5F2|nr:alpha/beta hydrolase [Tropicimonas marinistellae]
MPGQIQAGGIQLGCRIWGDGPVTVVFIHGNLASKDWIELAARHFPSDLRVIGIDWRGCGDSEKPTATADFSNYSMQQHAEDMLAALDALGIARCHLATHSTGGFIANRMQLAQPDRFGRILSLDPVSPFGLPFEEAALEVFRTMQADATLTRAVMAGVAPTLFDPDSLGLGKTPIYRAPDADSAALYDRLLAQTQQCADGIWLGTPFHLSAEHDAGEVAARMSELTHETLVLWGEWDGIIPLSHMQTMVERLPACRLVRLPEIGHSMNVEAPALYAGYVGAMFSGAVL